MIYWYILKRKITKASSLVQEIKISGYCPIVSPPCTSQMYASV